MDRHRDPDEPRGRRRVQRGIATLEFSLTVTMLLMFVCAVVGYGVLFWMQQQLASAASKARARRSMRALPARRTCRPWPVRRR